MIEVILGFLVLAVVLWIAMNMAMFSVILVATLVTRGWDIVKKVYFAIT